MLKPAHAHGNCQVCGRHVALNQNGYVRTHPTNGWGSRRCRGSHELPAPGTIIEPHPIQNTNHLPSPAHQIADALYALDPDLALDYLHARLRTDDAIDALDTFAGRILERRLT
jgi:hypothetical protein